jgi:hypothetical protein
LDAVLAPPLRDAGQRRPSSSCVLRLFHGLFHRRRACAFVLGPGIGGVYRRAALQLPGFFQTLVNVGWPDKGDRLGSSGDVSPWVVGSRTSGGGFRGGSGSRRGGLGLCRGGG